MIYEYAVDPELVAQWAKRQAVGLAAQFGLDQRRVISDLPTNWLGEVHSALLNQFEDGAGDPEYEQASRYLDALLQLMTANMVSRGLIFRDDQPWLAQALAVHQDEPFYAILARESVVRQPEVITERVVDQLHNELWYIPTVKPVRKTAPDLASILTPLLQAANKIVVVDPYFNPREPEYCEVLSALLHSALKSRGRGRRLPEVELIVGLDERRANGGSAPLAEQLKNFANDKYNSAVRYLANSIPKNMKLTFRCVADFPDGDKLHNRFVLTDFGGASLPYGTQALGALVLDDLSLLYKGQYEERWKQFTGHTRLKTIGSVQIIDGAA